MEQLRNFGYLLKDLGRLYTRRFEARAEALHLTLPQCKTLGYLSRNEGVSQVRLGELAEIDPMSMVRILDYMEAEGWVERRADPVDRRARCLYIKDKARAILDEIWQLADETRMEFLGDLSAEESLRLIDMLERIHVTARAIGAPPAASESVASAKGATRALPASGTSSGSTS
jgi:MarR family transcriptional regulator, transcriptional regulator for hemolysin